MVTATRAVGEVVLKLQGKIREKSRDNPLEELC